MFGKKSNRTLNLALDATRDVEATLIHFEGFLRAATTPETVLPTLQSLAGTVAQSEAAADVALRRMIDALAVTPLLPSTRQDLIEIATSCDRVANKCEHTANEMLFQQFLFPAEYGEEIMEIISVSREQFTILKRAIEMLFADFNALLKDHKMLDEIRALESRVDSIEQGLCKRIYALDMGLAERTQLARFVEMISDISDIIENIADRIQIMLITRKA